MLFSLVFLYTFIAKTSFSSISKDTKDLIRASKDLTHSNQFVLKLLYKLKNSAGGENKVNRGIELDADFVKLPFCRLFPYSPNCQG